MRKGTKRLKRLKRLKRTSTKRKSIKRKNKNTTIRRRVSNNKHTKRLKKIKGGFYFNKYANMFEKYLQNNNKQVVKLYSEQKSCSDPSFLDTHQDICPFIPEYIDGLIEERLKFNTIEKKAHPELKKVLDTIAQDQDIKLSKQIAKFGPVEQSYSVTSSTPIGPSASITANLRPNYEQAFSYNLNNPSNDNELTSALTKVYNNIETTIDIFVTYINQPYISRDDFKVEVPHFLQTIKRLLDERAALLDNYSQDNRLTKTQTITLETTYAYIDPLNIKNINVDLQADPTIKFKGNFEDFLKWLNMQSNLLG